MQEIATYQGRKIIWIDYESLIQDSSILNNSICFFIANQEYKEPDFNSLALSAIKSGVLEFKGAGKQSDNLYDSFLHVFVDYNAKREEHIMITNHINENLIDVFWQCFFVTCLPENTDYENLKVVCTDSDGTNRINEILDFLNQFENGWLPQ